MHFLNPHKKRAHYVRLMVGYVLVAIALAMGTLILVLLSYGYDLDRKTGAVIQNGLVFVSAQPATADVYVNGNRQDKTNAKLVLPGGQYTIELKRNGYRSWSRKITLQGGSVEQLDYPRLFPDKLVAQDTELYSNLPAFASQSPDHHWLLIQQPGQLAKFDVMDLTSDNATVTNFTLPANVVTASTDTSQSWHLVEWSSDNRHVLLRHHYADSDEFVLVDRQTPASSFNVGQLFGIAPSQATLRDKRFDQFYLYSAADKTLQTGDAKSTTVTGLLTHVVAFKPHDDKTVLFVGDDSAKAGQVTLKLYSSGKIYSLRQLPANDNYLLAIAHFNSRWYMAASAASENRTYVYRDPETFLKQHSSNPTLLPAIVLTINQPAFISVSDSDRFIAAQSGSHFAVYDAESDRRYYYDLASTITANQPATWMDGKHLAIDGDDAKVVAFDFDGTNQQIIGAGDPSLAPAFNSDAKWLYSFAPSITVPGRAAVIRTDLVAK